MIEALTWISYEYCKRAVLPSGSHKQTNQGCPHIPERIVAQMDKKPYGVTHEEWEDWKAYQADLDMDWRDFEDGYCRENDC